MAVRLTTVSLPHIHLSVTRQSLSGVTFGNVSRPHLARAAPVVSHPQNAPLHRVLVVGDNRELSALIAYHVARAGHHVTTVNGRDALETALEERPALVVIDASLPDMSGYELLAEFRRKQETQHMCVLLLTGVPGDAQRIHGLELGADDCLAAPWSEAELVLRVAAILRRAAAAVLGGRGLLVAGPIVLDATARSVKVDGVEINLTPTEFLLLRILLQRDGRVQSRGDLVAAIRGTPDEGTTRIIDMHMGRLRQKLGTAGPCIRTVRGVGYRFEGPGRRTSSRH